MGWIESALRKTKTFKKITDEYSRITESNFKTIKQMDEFNDRLTDRIAELNHILESKDAEIAELRKRYANIPDAAKHMEVVSECERLKFVNAELADDVRTLQQKIYELEHPTPDPTKLVVLEGPLKKIKTLNSLKRKTTKKAPKLARGTPRRKRSR